VLIKIGHCTVATRIELSIENFAALETPCQVRLCSKYNHFFLATNSTVSTSVLKLLSFNFPTRSASRELRYGVTLK